MQYEIKIDVIQNFVRLYEKLGEDRYKDVSEQILCDAAYVYENFYEVVRANTIGHPVQNGPDWGYAKLCQVVHVSKSQMMEITDFFQSLKMSGIV